MDEKILLLGVRCNFAREAIIQYQKDNSIAGQCLLNTLFLCDFVNDRTGKVFMKPVVGVLLKPPSVYVHCWAMYTDGDKQLLECSQEMVDFVDPIYATLDNFEEKFICTSSKQQKMKDCALSEAVKMQRDVDLTFLLGSHRSNDYYLKLQEHVKKAVTDEVVNKEFARLLPLFGKQ